MIDDIRLNTGSRSYQIWAEGDQKICWQLGDNVIGQKLSRSRHAVSAHCCQEIQWEHQQWQWRLHEIQPVQVCIRLSSMASMKQIYNICNVSGQLRSTTGLHIPTRDQVPEQNCCWRIKNHHILTTSTSWTIKSGGCPRLELTEGHLQLTYWQKERLRKLILNWLDRKLFRNIQVTEFLIWFS